MDKENAIEVRDVHKKFKIYHDKGNMLKERALHWSRNKYEERWVLNGISFDVKKGEAVGLIGHNGCGKSTTLKLLTKIMYPDSGSIELCGRVSSLLELGAGFHPDMSGRENIYINASIFGLSKREIDQRINDIITFSELEQFMDNPVRTYSSGMYTRLAFSVAINVNADILLIDEILAVGDVNFQAKCLSKLREIKRKGTTVVLVSHSPAQIEELCERSIWIHEGEIRMDGPAKIVDEEYLVFMGEKRRERAEAELAQKNEAQNEAETQQAPPAEAAEPAGAQRGHSTFPVEDNGRIGTGEIRFTSIKSYDGEDQEKYVFSLGDTLVFKLRYKANRPFADAYFGLSIFRNDGIRVYGSNSKIDDIETKYLEHDGEAVIRFPSLQLLPGHYYVDICVATGMDENADYWSSVNEFEVLASKKDIGIVMMEHEWII